MMKFETTHLVLGCGGESAEVMKIIVEHFCGWIDENDYDGIDFYEIKNRKPNI